MWSKTKMLAVIVLFFVRPIFSMQESVPVLPFNSENLYGFEPIDNAFFGKVHNHGFGLYTVFDRQIALVSCDDSEHCPYNPTTDSIILTFHTINGDVLAIIRVPLACLQGLMLELYVHGRLDLGADKPLNNDQIEDFCNGAGIADSRPCDPILWCHTS